LPPVAEYGKCGDALGDYLGSTVLYLLILAIMSIRIFAVFGHQKKQISAYEGYSNCFGSSKGLVSNNCRKNQD